MYSVHVEIYMAVVQNVNSSHVIQGVKIVNLLPAEVRKPPHQSPVHYLTNIL